MRRTVVLASLAIGLGLGSASPAAAQLRGGLVGGATYSKLTGDFIVSSDFKWNWFAGAYLELLYERNWSLVLELDYSRKGGKALTSNAQNIELDVGYVEVPLMANFILPVGAKWDAGLYGGLAVGVPIDCDVTIQGSKIDCSTGFSSAKTEWTLPLGARLGYKLTGGSMLYADVRYGIPLSEALEVERFRILTWHFLIRWSTEL